MQTLSFGRIVERLGDTFVAESLAFDQGRLNALVGGGADTELLRGKQAIVAAKLGAIVERVERDPNSALSLRISAVAEDLCGWSKDAGTTLAAGLRADAGGERPQIATTDPVARPLSEIARDIAPVFSLWESTYGGLAETGVEPGDGRYRVGAVSVDSHPACERALAALAADAELRVLLYEPTALHELGRRPRLGSKLFVALPVPLGGDLLTALIHGAYDLVRARGERGVAALLDELPRFLDRLRAGLAGERYSIPVLVGLGGLELDRGSDHISTPWGVIRPGRPADRDFVEEAPAAQAVLQFELETVLVLQPKDFSPTTGRLRREAIDRARKVGLAALLAQPPSVLPVGVNWAWLAAVRPTEPSVFDCPPERLQRQLSLAGEAEHVALAHMAGVVEDVHPEDADIAVTRCLRALTEQDPSDALIDAVIVWENLFGRSAELSFRLSTCVATLLGADAEERKELQPELKKLYDARSAIVHGEHPRKTIAQDSARATELAVQMLREVYLKRPELLALDPPQRVTEVLLG